MATQLLPSNPNLQHLKNQAKDLRRAYRGGDPEAQREVLAVLSEAVTQLSLSQAQHVIARRYSLGSCPRLKRFVETVDTLDIRPEATALRQAIDANQLAQVERLLAVPGDASGDGAGNLFTGLQPRGALP